MNTHGDTLHAMGSPAAPVRGSAARGAGTRRVIPIVSAASADASTRPDTGHTQRKRSLWQMGFFVLFILAPV